MAKSKEQLVEDLEGSLKSIVELAPIAQAFFVQEVFDDFTETHGGRTFGDWFTNVYLKRVSQ